MRKLFIHTNNDQIGTSVVIHENNDDDTVINVKTSATVTRIKEASSVTSLFTISSRNIPLTVDKISQQVMLPVQCSLKCLSTIAVN